MKKRFEIEPHTTIDKNFKIQDNLGDLVLYVDYDDVNHRYVDRATKALVKLMNEHQEELP